jgi:glucose/arabinose dehydrogenase
MRIPWPFVSTQKLAKQSAALVCTGIAALALLSSNSARGSDPLGTLVPTTVEVQSYLRSPPFNRARQLLVPPGFRISVVARIPRARFILPLPTGAFLVAQPYSGRIALVGPGANGASNLFTLISGLHQPQGMALHSIGGKLYLYVGESNEVSRFSFARDSTSASDKTVIVPDLPDSSSPELRGYYRHELKSLVIGPDDKLYVDIASSTNADPRDTISNPVRSAIYQYDLDGRNGMVFARGIRNAEGLDFVPGTHELWAAVNELDDVRYPFRNSWRHSGSIDYGKRITSYIDDHPPDELIHVKEGANYGWPFANPNPDTPNGLDDMPFAPNYETNPDWSRFPEKMFARVDKGIQAHSAPLGMAFLQDSQVREPFRNGLVIAYHGSWDRSRKTGYKVVFFPWQNGRPGRQVDLVSGWLNDDSQRQWGRPVDVKPASDDSLLISDDYSGTIYRLAPAR